MSYKSRFFAVVAAALLVVSLPSAGYAAGQTEEELARQIQPRMGPDAADDADPFILSHGCLRFPPRKGIFRGVRRPGRCPGGLFGRSEPFAAFGVEIAFQL